VKIKYMCGAPEHRLDILGCSAHIPFYKGVKTNCRDVLYLIIHMSHCCQMAEFFALWWYWGLGSATPHATHLSSTDLSTVLADPLLL
jgi:hypothetical protein